MPFFTTNPLMLYITWYSFHAFTKRVFVHFLFCAFLYLSFLFVSYMAATETLQLTLLHGIEEIMQ